MAALSHESSQDISQVDAGVSESDGSPFGINQFGRTAKTGGIYSTTRIPFQTAIKTTIEASSACTKNSIFWFMIRGLEVR